MLDPATIMALMSGGSALAGGAMSMFGKSKPAQTTQLQRYSPGQMQDMDQARSMAMQGLQDPTAGFQPIANQAMSRFQSDIVPGLSERFTSMGGGARGSSAYQGALSRAGAGLAGDLAGQQAQYGLQRMSGLQNLLGMGMQPQFESIYQPEQMGGAQMAGSQLFGSGLRGLGGSLQAFQAQKAQDGFATRATDKRNWIEDMYKKYPNFRG